MRKRAVKRTGKRTSQYEKRLDALEKKIEKLEAFVRKITDQGYQIGEVLDDCRADLRALREQPPPSDPPNP